MWQLLLRIWKFLNTVLCFHTHISIWRTRLDRWFWLNIDETVFPSFKLLHRYYIRPTTQVKGGRKASVRHRLHSELHFWYIAWIPCDRKGSNVADRKRWKKAEENFISCGIFLLRYLWRWIDLLTDLPLLDYCKVKKICTGCVEHMNCYTRGRGKSWEYNWINWDQVTPMIIF